MIIVIEGIDQSGKHTQSMLLSASLAKLGIKSKIFSFPDYTTPTGKLIQRYLKPTNKDRAASWLPEVMHCLQAANKWELVDDIKNAMDTYDVVIMNRYTASNYVYGKINGTSARLINNIEYDLPKANHTILLDLPVGASFSRNPKKRDRFEQDREFLDAVRTEYEKLAKKEKWQIIRADDSKSHVHEHIMDYLKPVIHDIKNLKEKSATSISKKTTSRNSPKSKKSEQSKK